MSRGLPPSILHSAVDYLMRATVRAEANGEFEDEQAGQARIMALCDRMDLIYFSDYPPVERGRARHEVLCKAAELARLAADRLRPALEDAPH